MQACAGNSESSPLPLGESEVSEGSWAARACRAHPKVSHSQAHPYTPAPTEVTYSYRHLYTHAGLHPCTHKCTDIYVHRHIQILESRSCTHRHTQRRVCTYVTHTHGHICFPHQLPHRLQRSGLNSHCLCLTYPDLTREGQKLRAARLGHLQTPHDHTCGPPVPAQLAASLKTPCPCTAPPGSDTHACICTCSHSSLRA